MGARAGQAEFTLGQRGYRFIRAEQGDDRSYTYWWSDARRQCVTIATMEGRYSSVTATTAPDCRMAASVRPDTAYGQPSARPPRPGYNPDPAFSQPAWPTNVQPLPHYTSENVDLGLVCFGEGQRPVTANRWGYRWDYRRDRYVYGNSTELATQDFDASVMIQIWEGGGRIHLPKRLVPPINSRGDHGWWTLKNVSTGRDMIRASYRLNGLNKPSVTIDRRSGRISIQGTSSYAFRGTCDQIGANAHPRF